MNIITLLAEIHAAVYSPLNGQKARILSLLFGKPRPLIFLKKGDIWEYFRPVQLSDWHMAESPKI